jgi:Ca-activated chloride channel family protein
MQQQMAPSSRTRPAVPVRAAIYAWVSSDHQAERHTIDSQVQELLALFEATEQFDDMMLAVDAREFERAKAKGYEALRVLNEKQQVYKSPKLQEQIIKMSDYVKKLDSVKTVTESERKLFKKSNKAMNYEVKKQRKQS